MNLFQVITQFPTQQACIDHIESIRFAKGEYCPLCGSVENVKRKKDGERVGRWNCHDCHKSFNVLSGTIMQGTHIPLQKWFVAISLVVNAKKSLSSYQLSRDLDLNQKSAWYMQQRIRTAMETDQATMLTGVLEADETYIGGIPKKKNKKEDNPKGGQGKSNKTPVIGVVERDGKVIAKVIDDATGKSVMEFIQQTVSPATTILITDENKAYHGVKQLMPHGVINHQKEYVNGPIHTNTIEGFWSLLKRAWYGTHHKYTVGFMPLFVAEASWKYNHRKDGDAWGSFMHAVFA